MIKGGKNRPKLRNINLDIPSEANMHPWNGLDSDVVEYQEPSSHVVMKGRAKRLSSYVGMEASKYVIILVYFFNLLLECMLMISMVWC